MQGSSEYRDYQDALVKRNASLILALLRCEYFGGHLPQLDELVTMLRVPKAVLTSSLESLTRGKFLEHDEEGYHFIPVTEDLPRIAFFCNQSLVSNHYGVIQDYLIGAEESFREFGYRMIIRDDFTSVGSKLNIAKRLWDEGVHGFVFSGFAEPRIRQWVLESRIPAIVVGNATLYQQDLARVCADNVGGVQQMLRYLVSQGHTEIACYAVGLENYHGIQERARSFEFGIEEMGMTPIRDLMFREVHSPDVARKASEIFLKIPIRPTAILCLSDREAFELMNELRASGIEIPRQVSIVGFENSMNAHISDPPLTSVEIFAVEMGRVAASFMKNEIQMRQIPVSMVLPAKVIVRQSIHPKGIAIANLIAERAKKTTKIPLPEM